MVNGNGGRQQENERHLVQGTWQQYCSTPARLRDKNGGWSPVTTRDPASIPADASQSSMRHMTAHGKAKRASDTAGLARYHRAEPAQKQGKQAR